MKGSFKAYDIRGRVPDELNEDLCYAIGRFFPVQVQAKSVVVGRDARLSGPALLAALIRGLRDAGADVTDAGVCGTEEIYHATANFGFGGGIILTASHNPADYNGMKLVRAGAVPVSGDSGLFDLRDKVLSGKLPPTAPQPGTLTQKSFRFEYADFLLRSVDMSKLKPLRIVADAGNGCAGPVLDLLQASLPCRLIVINGEPDGAFPNGVPNPLLPENRAVTSRAVLEHQADLGLAWDGDFDRCFFYDHQGDFIEGYYMVGLLAQAMLKDAPGSKILHDTRLTWNTIDMVRAAGGLPIETKTGHAFMKERMRAENAIYGGEMSAHHYFRDFAFCDSGMLPWLKLVELLSTSGRSLQELVADCLKNYPCSGEINSRVADAASAVADVRARYATLKPAESHIDGLSMDFGAWRFNLRSSNTEPLLRLNVESRADPELMRRKTEEILKIIRK